MPNSEPISNAMGCHELYVIRKSLGLTQAAMAKACGISRAVYQRYEQIRKPVPPHLAVYVRGHVIPTISNGDQHNG